MKKVRGNRILQLQCNQCGRWIRVENGIAKEGYYEGLSEFGYFSAKDGTSELFHLCENCYDSLINGFLIPVTRKNKTELL